MRVDIGGNRTGAGIDGPRGLGIDGQGKDDLVFATSSGETEGRVASEVRQALILWEPRIDLLDVSARNDEAEPTRLLIQIEYRVRATNNRFNLVYPFYVE